MSLRLGSVHTSWQSIAILEREARITEVFGDCAIRVFQFSVTSNGKTGTETPLSTGTPRNELERVVPTQLIVKLVKLRFHTELERAGTVREGVSCQPRWNTTGTRLRGLKTYH